MIESNPRQDTSQALNVRDNLKMIILKVKEFESVNAKLLPANLPLNGAKMTPAASLR